MEALLVDQPASATPTVPELTTGKILTILRRVVELGFRGFGFIPNSRAREILLGLGDRLEIDPTIIQEVGYAVQLIRCRPFEPETPDVWECLPASERDCYQLPPDLPGGMTGQQLRVLTNVRAVKDAAGLWRYHTADVARVLTEREKQRERAARKRRARQEAQALSQGVAVEELPVEILINRKGQAGWLFDS